MKPWTERKQIAAALKNEHVRIGERLVASSGIKLRGVYATKDFAAGDYVASYHGRVIPREELMALHESDRALFDRVNEYAVWHKTLRGHLYPEDIDRLGAHLINHSCGPNARWAQDERGAKLVRAVRPIKAEEEVTIHYGWLGLKAAVENARHPCLCEARFCAGTVELYVEIVEEDPETSGPYLPPEEAGRRLLADIVNDTDDNEALLQRYANNSAEMFFGGADIIELPDRSAFVAKLRDAARAAISAAHRLRSHGFTVSERRLHQIARSYEVPLTGDDT